ncbi:MAG TPA: MBOAT family O-acyltransferase [Candidatus Hydrogenedentes bacterium]|nr:MBOAT family protein [Candidatus Hydrogenedentota bacterium]HOV59946.1 MBOAT family O-acyltransferase [Candidatus Hydrogenedentota bacterium]
MAFTSWQYFGFLGITTVACWLLAKPKFQNLSLLGASGYFYWQFSHGATVLLGVLIIITYACGLYLREGHARRKVTLLAGVLIVLFALGWFKYADFLLWNLSWVGSHLGISMPDRVSHVLLPVGISFYVFRMISYLVDVYRGQMLPRKNLVDYALSIAYFPMLVAGPIERPITFLPQVERERPWDVAWLGIAIPLMIRGMLKKLVIADNVAVFADKVFMLDHPPLVILAAGVFAYTIQIYADFSGYTDMARASAKLVGPNLMENFDAPYLSVSPSAFWRRWHISFSTWIRDYIYIPLGGSRHAGEFRNFLVILLTMGISGLWHGAAWTYIAWGIYWGLLIYGYRRLGMGGHWSPSSWYGKTLATGLMFCFTAFGWLLFRAESMGWVIGALTHAGIRSETATVFVAFIFSLVLFYSLFLCVDRVITSRAKRYPLLEWVYCALVLVAVTIFAPASQTDFVYVQF